MDSIEVGGAQRLGKSLQPGRLRVALAPSTDSSRLVAPGRPTSSVSAWKLRVGMEAPCRHGSSVSTVMTKHGPELHSAEVPHRGGLSSAQCRPTQPSSAQLSSTQLSSAQLSSVQLNYYYYFTTTTITTTSITITTNAEDT